MSELSARLLDDANRVIGRMPDANPGPSEASQSFLRREPRASALPRS